MGRRFCHPAKDLFALQLTIRAGLSFRPQEDLRVLRARQAMFGCIAIFGLAPILLPEYDWPLCRVWARVFPRP